MWNLNDELFSYTWDLNMEISPQFLNFYKINGLIGKNATTITEAYGGYYKMSVKDFSDNIELPDISLDVIDSKLDKFAVKDKVSEDLFTAMRCFDAAVNELCNFGISQLGFKAYK